MNVFVFILLIALIITLPLYRFANVAVRRRDEQYGAGDTQLIQEIHRGLQRLEHRVEALETILLDKADVRAAGQHVEY